MVKKFKMGPKCTIISKVQAKKLGVKLISYGTFNKYRIGKEKVPYYFDPAHKRYVSFGC